MEDGARTSVGDKVRVVRVVNGKRELIDLEWGLVPYNTRRLDECPRPTMARDDTLLEKSAFKAAVVYRRCLLPMDSFTTHGAGGRELYVVYMRDRRTFAVAGLWELWIERGREKLETAALITVPANPTISEINNRMPAILDEANWDMWLDKNVPATEAVRLLRSYPGDDLVYERLKPTPQVDPEQASLFD